MERINQLFSLPALVFGGLKSLGSCFHLPGCQGEVLSAAPAFSTFDFRALPVLAGCSPRRIWTSRICAGPRWEGAASVSDIGFDEEAQRLQSLNICAQPADVSEIPP